MAKDRRNKTRSHLDLENEVRADQKRRVSNTNEAPSRRSSQPKDPKRTRPSSAKAAPARKKKKLSRAAIIIYAVLAALIVALVVTLIIGGVWLYNYVDTQAPTRDGISPHDWERTPERHRGQVAYYLFGLLGESEGDNTVLLSVACHDKEKNTVNVLELPASTYLNKGDDYKVDTLGRVYANPKMLDWCDACKKELHAPEIVEGQEAAVHDKCGTVVSSKKGSGYQSLLNFVNDQLGLPIDAYFIMETESLEILIDNVGGVDVNLSSARMLGDINYEAGLQTLTGPAAVDFILESEGAERTAHQREVLGAMLLRLQRTSDRDLNDKVVENLMDSKHPMLTHLEFSETLEDDEITNLIRSFKNVSLKNVTVRMLPGESTYDPDGDHVFTAHKDELLQLLNASYNPYGDRLKATDLLIPELANTTTADMRVGTLDQYVSAQDGTIFGTN